MAEPSLGAGTDQ